MKLENDPFKEEIPDQVLRLAHDMAKAEDPYRTANLEVEARADEINGDFRKRVHNPWSGIRTHVEHGQITQARNINNRLAPAAARRVEEAAEGGNESIARRPLHRPVTLTDIKERHLPIRQRIARERKLKPRRLS